MSKELLCCLCSSFLKEKDLFELFKNYNTLSDLESKVCSKFDKSQINLAKAQTKKMRILGIKVYCVFDDEYPMVLKNIDDPPPIIYCKGSYIENDENAIAVIGSRNASQRGKQLVEQMIKEFSGLEVTIVSGLALGIDTEAHTSALRNKLRTIAVLGSGLDTIYPYQNKKLLEKISENGVVFSEYNLGSKPLSFHFPRRNRIISGLSKAVVVVEAGEKSGSLITAKLAMEQNREVFVFPRTPTDVNSGGNNLLIKNGAKIITCGADVISDIFPQCSFCKKNDAQKLSISEDEKFVFEKVLSDPIHIDELSFLLDIAPSRLANSLLSLELKGLIREIPGKFFIRN